MSVALELLFALLALPLLLSCGYLLVLTLLSRHAQPLPRSPQRLRFDIVVPAHDEAAGIERTIASLRAIDWPQARFRILVVADNCTDGTAALARAAGAQVLERHDETLRGKGYALAHGFAHSLAQERADAVVVVDADADVSPNLLDACAARLERGAQAVQVHYGVRNPNASWRTRLIAIAKGAFHRVRSRARERLGVSAGIRGNGWCVTHALLRRVPFQAYSLTEDVEYGIALGLAGVRVCYADEASADADMETNGRAAASQRRRWEQGRFQLVRRFAVPLLRRALTQRSRLHLDLALDLLVAPLSWLAVGTLLLAALALGLGAWSGAYAGWLAPPLLCALSLLLYVLRGWRLSDTGTRGLADLVGAPFFIAWKLLTLLQRQRSQEWVRTQRRAT